ncbi:MAG: hypothetical protein DSO07_00400 [Thermoproteota archaeon]|uniref:Uncharacterized protein n=1 Tax=Candidatus Methanodesulfokora washburnensis TaxID=2478471 RepID=A0A429GH99_9CREN|nr:hypothetical protein [Candidatus Methanodesulfokores washburnensis]RSN73184.1 hypothetical protein D6D85_11220 [Candidatus Methanodesulfokores washburnensis]TDA42238.1 MAG: hypothetical protein DSO07_00400 [Candidatus Korarchaeota archaeon]
MIKVVLVALAMSSAMLFAILALASIHPLTILSSSPYIPLTPPTSHSAIAVTGDRVCYLYIYDIQYSGGFGYYGPSAKPPSDLYQYNFSISELHVEVYVPLGGFKNLSSGDVSARVFEVDRSSAFEVQRMIREDLRHSNYSQYLNIISGKGYGSIVSYVEQKAVQKNICKYVHAHFICNTTSTPLSGNAHIVEICFRRGVELSTTGINDTRIDRLVDLVVNASLYKLPDSTVNRLLPLVHVDVSVLAPMRNSVLLYPKPVHVMRALAFLAVFVSCIVLHYRFRPHEYAGFSRPLRRLRRRIYRQ